MQSIRFKQLLRSRNGHFDVSKLYIFTQISIEQGILILYYVRKPFLLGAALVDKSDSLTILWRSSNPIWSTQHRIEPIKAIKNSNKIYFYYKYKKRVFTQSFYINQILGLSKSYKAPILKRTAINPILTPIDINKWESSAVFNSGAVFLDDRVHLIYRAITSTGISVLGYASSNDGLNITERSSEPVYVEDKALPSKSIPTNSSHSRYMSGNSWSGCEDPRLTKIDDTIYMTYTSWDTSSPPYVALTSIKVEHFLKKNWNWKKPLQISPKYEQHKNWVMFPEKINGKFAILHSLTPNVLIQYFDTLDLDEISINSYYQHDKRDQYWDTWMRGVGPPPIKTNEGWLILYHAMDSKDPNRYKIGAMLLDLIVPTKILYRSTKPILEPDALYENHGHKWGVVYACGAVILNDILFVYYGAADTVLCVASHKLSQLLSGIKNSQVPFAIPRNI